jgi:hypothetical protein
VGRKSKSRLINDMDEPTALFEKLPNGKNKQIWRDRAYQLISSKHRICGKEFCEDITVCDDWCSRRKFTDWYNEQKEIQPQIDILDLEKDILIPDNKVYCPEGCVFVPDWFNLQFIERHKHRGDYPLGATAFKGGFVSNIGNGSGKTKEYLGFFKTPEDSHKAWQIAKISKLEQSLDRLIKSNLMGENITKVEVAVERKISAMKYQVDNGLITISVKSL